VGVFEPADPLDTRDDVELVPPDLGAAFELPTRAAPAPETTLMTCRRTTVRVGAGVGWAEAVTVTSGAGSAASAMACALALI